MTPMSPMNDLEKIVRSLEEHHARILEAQESAADPAIRQQLGMLAGKIKEGQSQFINEYTKAVAANQKQLEEAKKTAQETLKKVAEARAKMAAAAQEGMKPKVEAKKPEPEIDPDLGRKLRIELLERFGDKKPKKEQRGSAEGEIWEDWGEGGKGKG